MQVDVNQARSRAYSIFLRYFHFGINLLVAQLISKIQNTSCSQTFTDIGLPISYILIALNTIFILILRCRGQFNKKAFFVGLALDIILVGVCMVLGFGGIGESNSCANNKVLHRFAGFYSLIVLALTPMIMMGPFDWALRYTNAPANLVWPFLFFGFAWSTQFKGGMIILGLFHLALSLGIFAINILPIIKGITTQIQKLLKWSWVIGIIIMALCQMIALIVYMANSEANKFEDMIAKKLLQTYFPINIIDGLFWIWGMLTLKHASGDTIREGIMRGNDQNDDENDLDNRGGFGTLK